MIRKESSDGIGYSVVDLNGVSHVYASAVPRTGGTFEEQAHDALRTIEAVMHEEGTHGSIVQQAVFLQDSAKVGDCRRIMQEFYGNQMPATTYIWQPPCCGKALSVEALGVGSGGEDVAIRRVSDRLVVTRHGGVSWIHCGHVVPEPSAVGVYRRSMSAFRRMAELLATQGIGFEQVIRTWLYLGDIVGMEGSTQRYKELNRARTDFYRDIRFAEGRTAPGFRGTVYPASTGIGTDNHDIVMSCIALSAEPDRVQLMPLENPQQTSAFEYSARYSPQSPKFCRAMALTSGPCSTIFVSGTASITDSETRWVGDVERQTHQTLDNIEALISERNFRQYGWAGWGATLEDLALARVYIKNQDDFAKTRAACESRFGEVPTIYAVADVCRPELLVEIEGIAFSARCVR
ncbi:MAG TPA: dioxygenase [Planctomycetaceae bacterium]|nr:dioxygenase [Planctomycetaceae bacterium]HIQ21134.1 dioxygenase [Planctomycetota bacterium]